jgi:transposase-like protein
MNTEQKVLEVSAAQITKSLLSDLEELSRCAGEPYSAVFADSIIRKMREMVDKCMGDPYTEVVVALHDALAHQNRWLDYTAEQYQGAYNLFLSLVNRGKIDNTEVENSIIALEKLGFNTLPFSINFDDNSQEELDF